LRNRLPKIPTGAFSLIRIKDIAQRSGVSVTTVSHVLNKSRYVHPDTEARVLKVVQELNYRPNMLARSLRRHETHTIGLLVSDISNKYFTDVARAVETTAYERGYNMILCNTNEDPAKEALYFDVLLGKQIDGLIVAPARGDHSFIRTQVERGAYVVMVNRCLDGISTPAVICDDEEAAFNMIDLQIAAGHRRIGAIIGFEGVSTTKARMQGLTRAAEKHHLHPDDLWIYPGQSRQEGGYQAAQEIIRMTNRPSCVMAFNSVMLDGYLLGLADLAPHLLQEIEFTSFGYSQLARVFHPGAYYIDQPACLVGVTAAKILLDVLTGTVPWNTDTIVLQNTISKFLPTISPTM
jgi:LacI family transcriptional regulator